MNIDLRARPNSPIQSGHHCVERSAARPLYWTGYSTEAQNIHMPREIHNLDLNNITDISISRVYDLA